MSRTRAQDFDQKKIAIRSVATGLFSKVGFHATSMTQVAEAAGISKGLLYHYYQNKDFLLFDILETHLSDLAEDVENAASKCMEPEEKLNSIIKALLDNYHDCDDEHQIQVAEMSSLPIAQQETLRNLERRIVKPVNQAVSKMLPSEVSQELMLKPCTMTLFGMVNWCFMWFKKDGPMSRSDYAKLVSQIFLNGIRSLS
ncbi:TetR/AcrR family transcriptional regulator [Curvivirga aplysinae]|uniref:TetR/AcrR family transcriptional regulator n=1 Tax=Curvivirga aplysinae TaxID=2529852 RepID=UPI0012BC4F6B|nr:TetR/AcrR family transcriptional regulator [Curvivirga aplysinae]MTI09861.1 TetR/AcrR family transcriptional regulator [Curvivirga aplysinae]